MSRYAPMPAVIETARLRLRPWRESDAADYRTLWSERDPRSVRVIAADGTPTVGDLQARIRAQLAVSPASGLRLYAVVEGADFLGYCGVTADGATNAEPQIAYELLRHVHGHGIATEAAAAVCLAARATGRPRVWAGVRRWNAPSLRVLDKLEFVDSGRIDADPVRGDQLWLTRLLGESR